MVGAELKYYLPLLGWWMSYRERTTSIRISKEVRAELERLKVHRREPYDDVIRRLLEHWRRTRQ